ncbi:MAG: FAD:protein FMN transferase [Bacteroidetes bacterium]|nr:FAD:protein FMN transferase [Bacteroidota bacterium]
MNRITWIFVAGLFFILYSCSSRHETPMVIINGLTQGTYYSIKYFEADSSDYSLLIEEKFGEINSSMSIFDTSSIVSHFNNNDSLAVADRHFDRVITRALQISRETNGLFDITVGQLVNAWGFGFANKLEMNQNIIDSLLLLTGYQKINYDNKKVVKKYPRIKMDFNAIAQGYTVDVIAEMLDSLGLTSYLIDVGGEVRSKGKKPDGSLWKVGVEKPTEDMNAGREIEIVVGLTDKSLATSGSYRKYFEENGVRYSHTIDPHTGKPAQHTLLSVSVVANNCTDADAYATAFMVMGLDSAKSFLQKHSELDACFIYHDTDGKMELEMTTGFRKLQTE